MSTPSPSAAQADAAEETQAFGVAKELGTGAAWDALLLNNPKGFDADLVRVSAVAFE